MKAYIWKITYRNGNVRYLTNVYNRFPEKSADPREAKEFKTKGAARAEFKEIAKRNIGYETWELVLKEEA